jgi:hypothetical protein
MAIKIQYSSSKWGGSGIERMLDQLAREGQNESCAWSPAVDVFETADSVVQGGRCSFNFSISLAFLSVAMRKGQDSARSL